MRNSRSAVRLGTTQNSGKELANYYGFGESLVRFDVGRHKSAEMYATGSALNFCANIRELSKQEVEVLTALSTTKDGSFVATEAGGFKVGLKLTPILHGRMGSYLLFRTNTLRGWEVVYNRENTVWTKYMAAIDAKKLAAAIPETALVHFDGISLCTSPEGGKVLISLIRLLKKKGASVSFDFNYRKHLVNYAKVKNEYEAVLSAVDYLNISPSDYKRLGLNTSEARDGSELLIKKFSNLQAVFGLEKSDDGALLKLDAYVRTKNKFATASEPPYAPIELIGMGDAFAAYILHTIHSQKNPVKELPKALLWARLKSLVQGDASVPTLREMEMYTNAIAISR